MNRLQKIVAMIIALGTIVSGAIAYDSRKANQSEVDLLGSRLEQKIKEDLARSIQRRIWDLESHYGGPGVPNAPAAVQREYRELKADFETIRRNIDGDR